MRPIMKRKVSEVNNFVNATSTLCCAVPGMSSGTSWGASASTAAGSSSGTSAAGISSGVFAAGVTAITVGRVWNTIFHKLRF